MPPRIRHGLAMLATLGVLAGCGPGGPEQPLVDEPLASFPERLRHVGLYDDPADRDAVHPRAARYEPRWPLWSNGSDKTRYVLLPEGTTIDARERDAWDFPDGTLFFKTFSFADASGSRRPLETRVLRVLGDDVDYAVYRWNDDATAAKLLPMEEPRSVAVDEGDGEPFEHSIPSRLQCRQCHESNVERIIGFDELQLGGSQLRELAELFEGPIPDETRHIDAEDPQTQRVIGYARGNCAHCHNGRGGPSGSFDLRPDVFVDNTVGAETRGSGTEAGIRVVPGRPEESILFLALTGRTDGREIKDMPPVGVQKRDREAIALYREWIAALEPEAGP